MVRIIFCGCVVFGCAFGSGAALHSAEGKRLPATPSAEISAAGHGPELAVDQNEATLWIANLAATPANNKVWFQLDLGAVKPMARLHWRAAQGAPYPASSPRVYRVLISADGSKWTRVENPSSQPPVPATPANEPNGNVLLNVDARYVRLETTQVNDGTGWSLGLREIWVTEGRDTSQVTATLRPRIAAADSAVTLKWSAPPALRPAKFKVYRSDNPRDKSGEPLAILPGSTSEFEDQIPNWSVRYYRIEAIDARGASLLVSDLAAAVARPAAAVVPRVETFAFWYETYKPSTDPDASLKQIGNSPIVIGPQVEFAQDLAKNGRGLLPYVTYYQSSNGVEALPQSADPKTVAQKIASICFFRKSIQFPGCPAGFVPTIFSRPDNIEFKASSVQYTVCPGSVPFRKMALAQAVQQLSRGARGFFVDNGYDDDFAARAVCESTEHEHYYGDHVTAADAFLGLVLEVTCEVKRRHPDGIVMVNGGVPANATFFGLTLGDVCDGQLWESYLRSSHSTPKEHVSNWQQVYQRSIQEERGWLASPARRMFVLSYPWDRREAYFCYATAKLCQLPWSACLGVSDPEHKVFGGHFGTYPELVDLRLGRPVNETEFGGVKSGESFSREYEHGLVLVNPTASAQQVNLPLRKPRRYRDVFAATDGNGTVIQLELPAESGRVFIWK